MPLQKQKSDLDKKLQKNLTYVQILCILMKTNTIRHSDISMA